jgi:hypothetical protein
VFQDKSQFDLEFMKKISRLFLVLSLTAMPAMAQFEGIMDMKVTMTDGNGGTQGTGDLKVSIGKPGARTEMTMQAMQMNMKMVMLIKTDTPDVMYRIDDEGKSYSEISFAKKPGAPDKDQDTGKYTVQKLGEEKILGYKTQHVLVMHDGTTNEMWMAKDFLDYTLFQRLQAHPGSKMGNEGMEKALKDAGAEGMPLKAIMPGPNGGKLTMELVKADKQSLPTSTFDIPAGYAKSAGGMMDLGGVSSPQMDEMKKKMQDAMKNMTPEQRQQLEQMMKQRGIPQQ